MAKQRRGTTRAGKTKRTSRAVAAPRRKPPARPVRASAKRPKAKPVAVARPARPAPAPEPPPPPPAPPRKPGFYEAVAIYERGVQGLQQHDYAGAADLFRTVIERYPEERELLERARLYLRVCERETARNAPVPETPDEQVIAATVSLNAGDHAAALHHLQRAINADPSHDHAHYIMSAALSMRGRREEALEHLYRAVELNPENRALAKQDRDLENLHDLDGFRSLVDAPAVPRRRPRRR